MFELLAPEFAGAYADLSAESPQECSEITAHLFSSFRFDTTHSIPSYRAWLDSIDHIEAYRFHKRFLQHLQHADGAGRWVLKCPDHVFALAAVRAVYPDARMIFCHRSPMNVLASNAMLTRIVREPFSDHVDSLDIGRQESDRCLLAVQRMIETVERQDKWNGGIFHLRHADLTADPMICIRALYDHFGLTLSEMAQARMERLIRENPNGGYKPRRYKLEDYGLDATRERRRFADYIAFMETIGQADHRARPMAPELRPAMRMTTDMTAVGISP